MKRGGLVVGLGLGGIAVGMVLMVMVTSMVGGLGSGQQTTSGSGPAQPTPLALSDIPAAYLADYQSAAGLCPGLQWTVLAGIGKVETDHGGSGNDPAQVSPAGAEGPMQFMPATFAAYHLAGETNIDNPKDAVDAASKYLCANGAGDAATLSRAVFAYNHLSTYVANVLGWAAKYGTTVAAAPGASLSDGEIAAVGKVTAESTAPVLPGAPYPATSFPYGQCTYWAALNHLVTWGGNAWQWWPNSPAAQHSATPAVGDIVVYGQGGRYSGYGHVAVVIGVHGGGYTVSEMNYLGLGIVDERDSPWPDPAVEGFIR